MGDASVRNNEIYFAVKNPFKTYTIFLYYLLVLPIINRQQLLILSYGY